MIPLSEMTPTPPLMRPRRLLHNPPRRRWQQLRPRLAVLDRDLEAGRVHITRGGKRLLRHRLHLDQAGMTKEQWREL